MQFIYFLTSVIISSSDIIKKYKVNKKTIKKIF